MQPLALVLLFANAAQETPTMPPSRDARAEQTPAQQGTPTDPLFDRPAHRERRTGVRAQRHREPRGRVSSMRAEPPRCCASRSCEKRRRRIVRQNESTRAEARGIGETQGMASCPSRIRIVQSGLPSAGEARMGANFIVQQISFHETTVAQFRAQMNGKSDAELRRALRESLPGYQQNLDLLLQLKL